MQSLVVIGPAVLVVALVLALILPLIVERWLPAHHREANLQSSLAVSSSITAPFMVFLGFMIVMLWGQMNEASAAVIDEADALRNVDALVDQMDPDTADRLRADIVAYAEAAVAEWPALAEGRADPAAEAAFRTLRDAVLSMVQRGQEGVLVDHAVSQVLDAQAFRSERIAAAQSDLPPVFWVVLLVGTALYVAYIVLTDTGPVRSRIAITFIALGVMGVSILLVAMLDNPFRGDIRTDPQPFLVLGAELTQP
ncbi:MAG: DUF4239 domain-containing protein [Chloroflexi bacterium]|nr:DUF4239 domain-containing protein [Chloroflexota bacterium]